VRNNTAQRSGGGMSIEKSGGVVVQHSAFDSNKAIAENGGGI
jgi:hypothetical protein